MADTESVKQLAVEAARAGDKEEARNLFRLLTRETPKDAEAWLWLAGVAEDQDEKRAALEQVLQLDPSNTLASESLQQMGVTPRMAQATAPMDTSSAADFGFDDDPFAVPDAVSAPPPPREIPPPARSEPTRELTPDEEFAMSLDSFGSMSSSYSEREKAGDDNLDFDIPDFGMGDDDDFDMQAYMNRERVDPSQVEVTAEEIKAPKRKPIGETISKETAQKIKNKKPKTKTGSSGMRPLLLIGLVGLVAVLFLLWFLNRGDETPVVEPTAIAEGIPTIPVTDDSNLTPQPYPGTDQPGGVPGDVVPTVPPIDQPGGEQPGAEPTQPPVVIPPDPELGNVQPTLLAPGVTPIVIDNWYFNYTGVSGVADGNEIGVQPQGRWVTVGVLMFDGTATGREIPDDLLVLKDAQGRVYRPNPAASEAYLNRYPGSFTNHMNQTAPTGVNFDVPLLFDVAPDATDLVMFSPVDTTYGYFVRQSPY